MLSLFAVTLVAAEHAQTYAIGWGTLSLINAGLAQSKDRSGLLWWFLSLFLGPVATFLLVVFVQKETPLPPPSKPSGIDPLA